MEEVWKPIKLNTRIFYEVSNLGNVRSWHPTMNGKKMKLTLGTDGYPTAQLKTFDSTNQTGKRNVRVGRLVLLHFVGEPPEGYECRHLDGNPLNNTLENLEWSSHIDNIADKHRHGTMAKGARNGRARLTPAKVQLAANMREAGMLLREIADVLSVNRSTIGKALKGDYWQLA